MSHPRLALAAILSIALLAILSVSWPSEGEPRIKVARHVAVRTWGDVCAGRVAIRKIPMTGRTIGLSTWDWSPNHYRIDCVISLRWNYRWSYWQLCALIVHEYGHLAGQHHSRNPWSVMYRDIWRPFWRCGPDHNHPRFGSARR